MPNIKVGAATAHYQDPTASEYKRYCSIILSVLVISPSYTFPTEICNFPNPSTQLPSRHVCVANARPASPNTVKSDAVTPFMPTVRMGCFITILAVQWLGEDFPGSTVRCQVQLLKVGRSITPALCFEAFRRWTYPPAHSHKIIS